MRNVTSLLEMYRGHVLSRILNRFLGLHVFLPCFSGWSHLNFDHFELVQSEIIMQNTWKHNAIMQNELHQQNQSQKIPQKIPTEQITKMKK